VDWRAPLGLFSLFHIMQPYFLMPFEMYDARWDTLSQRFLCEIRDEPILDIFLERHVMARCFDVRLWGAVYVVG